MPELVASPDGTIAWTLDGSGNLVLSAREGEAGTNEHGEWLRLESGIQICAGKVVLEHFSADILRAFWTFPQPFAARIRVTFTIETASSGALFPNIGVLRYVPSTVEQADLRAMRTAGGTAFASGDTVTVNAFAIGSWK